MTVHFSSVLDHEPQDPATGEGKVAFTCGHVVLGGGTGLGTEVLSSGNSHTAGAHVFATREVAGGALGNLTATWNKATNTVSVQSANAGDTSTVAFLLVG